MSDQLDGLAAPGRTNHRIGFRHPSGPGPESTRKRPPIRPLRSMPLSPMMLPKGHSGLHSIKARRMLFARLRSCARPASQSSDSPEQQEGTIQRPKSKSGRRFWLQTRRLIDRCRPYGFENDRCSDQTSLDGHTPASRASPYFPALFIAQIGPRHCGEISNPFHRCANITAKARENC
jgi:hypothetical protein